VHWRCLGHDAEGDRENHGLEPRFWVVLFELQLLSLDLCPRKDIVTHPTDHVSRMEHHVFCGLGPPGAA
jgi:hypothetical protein